MNLRLKHTLNLFLIVSAVALTGCGKKDNKVNSNNSSAFNGTSPFSTGYSPDSIIQQASSIKNNVTCMNGYRLNTDYSFFIRGGAVSGTKINGQWTPGVLTGGSVNKLWVGVSAYRDLMFVTQVANGSAVVGYNVTLSFCELKNTYSTLPSIISNERVLKNFATPYGIILDQDSYCGYSVVDLAQYTYITSERNLSNPYSPPDVQIPTSYTKPTCNGKF